MLWCRLKFLDKEKYWSHYGLSKNPNRIWYSYNGISFTKHNFCETLSRIIKLHYICSPSSIYFSLFFGNQITKWKCRKWNSTEQQEQQTEFIIILFVETLKFSFHQWIVEIIIETNFNLNWYFFSFRCLKQFNRVHMCSPFIIFPRKKHIYTCY